MSTDPIVARVQQVLATERDAIDAAIDRSAEAVAVAARTILDREPGDVIVTGVGKSGHVARKMAATLTSVGTRAHYLSTAEMFHGDLGTVDRAGVVIIISKSGSGADIAQLVDFATRRGIALIGDCSGEVWFKFDRALPSEAAAVNGVPLDLARVTRNLALSAENAPTWVQTCWFAMDGQAPDAVSRATYCDALRPLAGRLAGVHLYGLARPSLQPGASRLSRLSEAELAAFAAQIRETTGLAVTVSP